MSKVDMVEHPPHYTFGEKFEVIDVISNWGIVFGFCIGSAIKYIARAEHKGNRLEDLKKGKWYINHILEHVRKNGILYTLVISDSSNKDQADYVDVILDWKLDLNECHVISSLFSTIYYMSIKNQDGVLLFLEEAQNHIDKAIADLES